MTMKPAIFLLLLCNLVQSGMILAQAISHHSEPQFTYSTYQECSVTIPTWGVPGAENTETFAWHYLEKQNQACLASDNPAFMKRIGQLMARWTL